MTPTCLACGRSDHETPLVQLLHRGVELYICPQHLPILIHNPAELVGKLAEATFQVLKTMLNGLEQIGIAMRNIVVAALELAHEVDRTGGTCRDERQVHVGCHR